MLFAGSEGKTRKEAAASAERRPGRAPGAGGAAAAALPGNLIRPRTRWGTKVLIRIGMLGAVAFALMYAEFYLPGFPVFLQYDPGDVPTLIGGFAMGPLAGAAVAGIKALIFFLSGKDEAGIIGTAANLATSLAFVIAAAAVYARLHTRRGALLGLAAGVVSMVVVMAVLNGLVFLPAYGIPADGIWATVQVTSLFNVVKGTLNSGLTYLVYKKVSPLLHL